MFGIIKDVIKKIYWKLPFNNDKKRYLLDRIRSKGPLFLFNDKIDADIYRLYTLEILNSPRNLDFHSPLIPDSSYVSTPDSPKLIAYYLTQFHPTPENDLWWGKGVTEWNNVFRAVPQFVGHYQPRIPGELGAYDLRLKENLERQVELAKMGGVYGFAFYYYWFDGETLLRGPLDLFIENKDIDFPFMLCWANESWTKRFDGTSQDQLMVFSPEHNKNINFIIDAKKYLLDDRYICHDGMPVIQIYKPNNFDDIKSLIDFWRESAREEGLGEVHFMAVLFGDASIIDWKSLGFDSANDFQPGTILSQSKLSRLNAHLNVVNEKFVGQVYRYSDCIDKAVLREDVYPAVMPSWDNSARRIDSGLIFHDASPEMYSQWLSKAIKHTIESPYLSGNFVFINAWNEWGEGAYLEPDKKYGYSYLNTTRKVVSDFMVNI